MCVLLFRCFDFLGSVFQSFLVSIVTENSPFRTIRWYYRCVSVGVNLAGTEIRAAEVGGGAGVIRLKVDALLFTAAGAALISSVMFLQHSTKEPICITTDFLCCGQQHNRATMSSQTAAQLFQVCAEGVLLMVKMMMLMIMMIMTEVSRF